MGLVISKGLTLRKGYIGTDDPDAEAYIAAVEAADLAADPTVEPLETATKVAIHSFVKGAKADGFWPAIKASCILAGARTRLGALTPLRGTAPTSFNFVDGDYNRKTGLVGDGSTKYLDSNRSYSDDPQNNFHLSVYISTAASSGTKMYIGGQPDSNLTNDIYRTLNDLNFRSRGTGVAVGDGSQTGFAGHSRVVASSFSYRVSGVTAVQSSSSLALSTPANMFVFARNSSGSANLPGDARLAFYSIGESLDLALLDARVTDLINAFGAAIP
jgi:hypothetical protein